MRNKIKVCLLVCWLACNELILFVRVRMVVCLFVDRFTKQPRQQSECNGNANGLYYESLIKFFQVFQCTGNGWGETEQKYCRFIFAKHIYTIHSLSIHCTADIVQSIDQIITESWLMCVSVDKTLLHSSFATTLLGRPCSKGTDWFVPASNSSGTGCPSHRWIAAAAMGDHVRRRRVTMAVMAKMMATNHDLFPRQATTTTAVKIAVARNYMEMVQYWHLNTVDGRGRGRAQKTINFHFPKSMSRREHTFRAGPNTFPTERAQVWEHKLCSVWTIG